MANLSFLIFFEKLLEFLAGAISTIIAIGIRDLFASMGISISTIFQNYTNALDSYGILSLLVFLISILVGGLVAYLMLAAGRMAEDLE
ncbi:MAG: hypothetical protein KIY12_06925 [Thermoplasmata archaeon]|uniref:Uncharacterized protein n=1 Tax=Candidatus Sysuiplasma superficiale TaxID=2823368 RepID=A0A8J7YP80_9ARCH|nr:hypothetical protein [Candidatus Sysuiplasma superficiale]MBX8644435.1 hypothetical protein [Candidatus Sysuiplasma superficiale]